MLRLNLLLWRIGAVVMVLWTSSAAWSQTVLGTLLGRITDPAGASVPRAAVTVRNTRTGVVNRTSTNSVGDYQVSLLPAGEYEITVEMAGFRLLRKTDIVLNMAQQLRADLTLEVGELSQTVLVEGQAGLLNTETPEIAQVISNRSVAELPLNGREFVQLVQLAPGANAGPPGNAAGSSFNPGGAALGSSPGTASLGGGNTESLGFMLDGVENTDLFQHQVAIRPSIDAIQEFKVQDKLMPAEFGGTTTGIISAITKSGTNQYHGTLWDFLRNDKLDARSFFDAAKPIRRRNQYGFVLGGPLAVPKLYSGKNRTFFFANYEATRLRTARTAFGTVPTAAMKAGDLSQVVPAGQLFDPLSAAANGQRVPFAGSVIPRDRWNPTSAQLLQFFPEPNLPGSGGPGRLARNYTRQLGQPNDIDQVLVRLDHAASGKDRIFGRYSWSDDASPTASLLPLSESLVEAKVWSGAVGYTRILSPSTVNELKIAVLHRRLFTGPQSLLTQPDFNQRFGFQSREQGVPGIGLNGLTGFGGGNIFDLPLTNYSIYESFSKISGGHSFKFGFQNSRIGMNNRFSDVGGGGRSFNGNNTRQIGSPANTLEGRSFADFLLGYASQVGGLNVDVSADKHRPRFSFYNFYVQDDWKATRNLTINLGLRYDLFLPPMLTNGRGAAYFDFQTGEIVYPEDAPLTLPQPWPARKQSGRELTSTGSTNFGPRVGFAYRLGSSNRTVVRGGYGIMYDPGTLNVAFNNSQVPPFFKSTTLSANPDETVSAKLLSITLDVAPANVPLSLPVSFKAYLQNTKTGLVQQWALSLDHQITPTLAAGLSYVGWKSDHFLVDNPVNFPQPGPGNPQARRPYPAFGSSVVQMDNASGNVHALQSRVEKRLSHGLSFLGGFAWQHAIGNSISENASDIWLRLQRYDNLRLERSSAEWDVRLRLTFSVVYELPFFSSFRGVPGQLLHGWQAGAIYIAQTGFPVTPYVAADLLNRGSRSTTYANTNGRNANLPRDKRRPERWFDTSTFSAPAPYTYGNVGRNMIRTDGIDNVDFSLSKNFHFDEVRRLQFRTEFFNLANHPSFGVPVMAVDNPAFGRVFSTFNLGRQIQLALKLYF